MKISNAGLLSLFLGSTPSLLLAQTADDQHPMLAAKFHAAAGGYFGSGDFVISADGSTPGAGIDFGRELDADDSSTSPLGAIAWRFGEKWSLRLQGFRLEVEGGRELDHDVQFGDVTFLEGTNVSAGLDTSVLRAFLGRTFSTGTKHEFGAGFGLHWMQLDAFIAGEVFVNDQSPEFARESVDADLPLPNIGAWYWYAPSNRWLITSRLDWFSASVGDYSGSLWDVGVGAQYQISKHFGVGAEYSFFDLSGDIDQSSWRGEVEISTTGPSLYLTANW
jgi:hypothetical protein